MTSDQPASACPRCNRADCTAPAVEAYRSSSVLYLLDVSCEAIAHAEEIETLIGRGDLDAAAELCRHLIAVVAPAVRWHLVGCRPRQPQQPAAGSAAPDRRAA